MTLFQAFLVGVIYWFGNSSFARGYFVFSKPLVCGFLVGLVFGNPLVGATAGASINMIYLGWIGAGGSTPADPCAAGTLGTAFVLASGLSISEALVLAVPIGLAAISLYTLLMTLLSVCPRISYKMIEAGKSDKLWFPAIVLPMLITFVVYGIPCMILAYFGSGFVQSLVGALSGRAMSVVALIGGMLPAIGIAINLTFIYKGAAKIFLLIGFMCAVYLNFSLIAVGLVGFIGAAIYMMLNTKKEEIANA